MKRLLKISLLICCWTCTGGVCLFSQSQPATAYFSGGINPIAPISEGWDFSVTKHLRKFSLTLLYRGGFRAQEGGLLEQMFTEYGDVRLDINHTFVVNPRYHFRSHQGLNQGLYLGGLLGYETWTIQSRAEASLGAEVEEGNAYAGFNTGYIWYPSIKQKENPRFFVDAYLHFIWKLAETEAQLVGDQLYEMRTFAVTFVPTIHLGYRF